jgi:hypothetical protein
VPGIKLAVCLKVALEEAARYTSGKLAYRWVLGQDAKKEGLEEAVI